MPVVQGELDEVELSLCRMSLRGGGGEGAYNVDVSADKRHADRYRHGGPGADCRQGSQTTSRLFLFLQFSKKNLI
jgi:hypothetical protein